MRENQIMIFLNREQEDIIEEYYKLAKTPLNLKNFLLEYLKLCALTAKHNLRLVLSSNLPNDKKFTLQQIKKEDRPSDKKFNKKGSKKLVLKLKGNKMFSALMDGYAFQRVYSRKMDLEFHPSFECWIDDLIEAGIEDLEQKILQYQLDGEIRNSKIVLKT